MLVYLKLGILIGNIKNKFEIKFINNYNSIDCNQEIQNIN